MLVNYVWKQELLCEWQKQLKIATVSYSLDAL